MMENFKLFHDEHIYSGLVRYRYITGQMFITDRAFFEKQLLPEHWLRSQAPLCANVKAVVEMFERNQEGRFNLRLNHTPLAPWLLSYPTDKKPSQVELSGLRNNIEENPFNTDRRWKFCPQCIEENTVKYGIGYWRSSHQLLGARICSEHNTALHSHDELRYLNFTLPYHWLDKSEALLIEDNWQQDWQPFIYKLSKAIHNDVTLAHQMTSEIKLHLNLPSSLKTTQRPFFNELFLQMKNDIGEACLAGLFTAYARGIKRPPNILWVTLTDFTKRVGLRHPLYWLSILFWLRHELPTMRKILC